jgi:hypothetical protein
MKSNKLGTGFFPLANSDKSNSFRTKFTENRRLCLWGIALASCALVRGYETSFVGNIAGEPAFKYVLSRSLYLKMKFHTNHIWQVNVWDS